MNTRYRYSPSEWHFHTLHPYPLSAKHQNRDGGCCILACIYNDTTLSHFVPHRLCEKILHRLSSVLLSFRHGVFLHERYFKRVVVARIICPPHVSSTKPIGDTMKTNEHLAKLTRSPSCVCWTASSLAIGLQAKRKTPVFSTLLSILQQNDDPDCSLTSEA